MACYSRATTQKLLVKEQGSELFVVQNPQTSVKNALDFLKKMTVIAVSSITFVRKLFPEDAFADKQLEGQPIKILRGLDNLPDTKTMVNWLKYAFDLVSKQYLRKIVFVIEQEKSNKENTGQTIETYTFFYDYNEEQICYQMLSEDGQQELSLSSATLHLPEHVANSVRQLLRSVNVMTSTLEPLPSNACEFSLRLELTENTPDDFQPPEMFNVIESYDISFPSDTTRWKLGKIPTKFTTFTISAKSVYSQLNEQKEQEEVECIDDSQTEFRPLTSDLSLSNDTHISIDTSADFSKQDSIERIVLSDSISLRLSPSSDVQEVSSPAYEYQDKDSSIEEMIISPSPLKKRKVVREP